MAMPLLIKVRIRTMYCLVLLASTVMFSKSSNAQEFQNQFKTLRVENLKRTFLLHLPPTLPNHTAVPLVIVLHGGGGTARNMIGLTRNGFNVLADKENFIVVYPNGIGKHWNDGRGSNETQYRTQRENTDDCGFISALIDAMIRSYHADPKRVYVTGISNGAIMTYRLGCALSQKIAAIAPVDGNISANFLVRCNPSHPVSVLAINSTNDPLVPWEGGEITGPFGYRNLGMVMSVQQSVDFWVTHDACNTTPKIISIPDRDTHDGSTVKKYVYTNGKNHTEVILYAIKGGGHTWPGGRQYLPVSIIGQTCYDFDATRVIWDFFKMHPQQ